MFHSLAGDIESRFCRFPMGLLLTLLCLIFTPATGQTPQLDSIRSSISSIGDSYEKAKSLHQLFLKALDKKPNISIKDAYAGLQLAKKLDDKELIAMFLTDLGNANYIIGEISNSKSFFFQALKEIEIKTPDYPIGTLISLSNFYRSTGKFDSAQYYLNEASSLLDESSPSAIASYYQSLGWLSYNDARLKEAIQYAKRKISLNPDPSAYSLLFRSYIKLELYDSAKLALTNAFQFYANDKDTLSSRNYISLIINRGEYFIEISDYAKALYNYELAYQAATQNNFNILRAYVGQRLGYFFEINGNYPKAIELYDEAIETYTVYDARHQIAKIYGRIAWSLIYSNNKVLAEQFAHRARLQMKAIPDKVGVAFAWNILGYINFLNGDYTTALVYYDSAMTVRKNIDRQLEYYKTLSNIAEVFEQKGDLSKALEQLKQVLHQEESNSREINNMIFTYHTIGRIYFKLGDKINAEKYYLLAYDSAKGNKLYPQLKKSLNNLLDYYSFVKNGNKVLKYYGELKAVNDTLASLEQNNRILQVSALRELEVSRREMADLRSKANMEALIKAKQDQALSLYSYLVTLLVFILILLAYIIYSRKKNQIKLIEVNKQLETNVQERTEQLKMAYEELETYFYKASHDLRGPITSLIGLVGLLKSTKSEDERIQINQLLEETANKQLNLVNKIQSLNEVLKYNIRNQEINLQDEIQFILERHKKKISEKEINISLNLKTKIVNSTPFLLSTILDNLIYNAIDFSNNPHPKIEIGSETNDKGIIIYVIDNGEGIQKNISNNLYKMFFRGSLKSSGFGLGLYTAKKAAEKLGATISFDSEPHVRTEFKVLLNQT